MMMIEAYPYCCTLHTNPVRLMQIFSGPRRVLVWSSTRDSAQSSVQLGVGHASSPTSTAVCRLVVVLGTAPMVVESGESATTVPTNSRPGGLELDYGAPGVCSQGSCLSLAARGLADPRLRSRKPVPHLDSAAIFNVTLSRHVFISHYPRPPRRSLQCPFAALPSSGHARLGC
jgi:hypothetical protein